MVIVSFATHIYKYNDKEMKHNVNVTSHLFEFPVDMSKDSISIEDVREFIQCLYAVVKSINPQMTAENLAQYIVTGTKAEFEDPNSKASKELVVHPQKVRYCTDIHKLGQKGTDYWTVTQLSAYCGDINTDNIRAIRHALEGNDYRLLELTGVTNESSVVHKNTFCSKTKAGKKNFIMIPCYLNNEDYPAGCKDQIDDMMKQQLEYLKMLHNELSKDAVAKEVSEDLKAFKVSKSEDNVDDYRPKSEVSIGALPINKVTKEDMQKVWDNPTEFLPNRLGCLHKVGVRIPQFTSEEERKMTKSEIDEKVLTCYQEVIGSGLQEDEEKLKKYILPSQNFTGVVNCESTDLSVNTGIKTS